MLRTSLLVVARIALALAAAFAVGIIGLRAAAAERSEPELRLIEAAAILQAFTAEEESAIPTELLARAHGVAVIPNVIRGGFLLGGRRGRGVLVVKTASGAWSNPALITLTGMATFTWMFAEKVINTRADHVLTFDLRQPVWIYYCIAWIGLASAVALLVLRTFRLLVAPEKLAPQQTHSGE